MMQKRKFNSLLLISFLVVFAFSYSFADDVVYESKVDFMRCHDGYLNVQVTVENPVKAMEIVLEVFGDGNADFDVVDVDWKGSFAFLNDYQFIDLSRIHADGPDTIRLAAIDISSGNVLPIGTHDVANIFFTTNRACEGVITVDEQVWADYANPTGTIQTQFVLEDASLVIPSTTAGTVALANIAPTIDDMSNADIHWGDDYSATATGADGDEAACEVLTYSLVTNPTGMTIEPATGAIFWSTDGDDVGSHDVQVMVTDSCGATATNEIFTICVQNDPPEFDTETDTTLVGTGETVYDNVAATDPDGGPSGLTYSVVSFDAPDGTSAVVIDPVTGDITIDMTTYDFETPDFIYELVLAVTDNGNLDPPCAPENADTMSLFYEVIPMRFIIEKEHGPEGKGVLQGQFTEVDILMPDEEFINHPMGGFDFLIQYDNSVLTLFDVMSGDFIDNCDWEYFTWRVGPFGNCGDGCPSGMIRIVAMAEYNDGANHPICFDNNPGFVKLATLKFLVSNDRTYECMFVPIRFIWIDCGDNTVSDVDGARLFTTRTVWDYVGEGGGFDDYYEVTNIDNTDPPYFPTIYGSPVFCDSVDGKIPQYRYIDFYNGGVDIICAEVIDDRGDLNLDGLGYTIADAVMFTNYFVYGLNAFDYVDGAIAASDVNADGLTLTVADLVYLIRVIVGDALPYSKLTPVNAKLTYTNAGVISVDGPEMGAVYLVLQGDIDPVNMTNNMDMLYNYREDGNTHVIIYSHSGEAVTGNILNADANIISVEMATKDGAPVDASMLPKEFSLKQNYPNPFNPETVIGFNLVEASDYELTIYNVTGQVVDVFSGSADAGSHQVKWNASNVASGVYFYKLNAGNFTETKKMVLLK